MCADGDVTILLKAMNSGDSAAAEKLLPLVYNELHRLAMSYMRRERSNHTLQPTALINEAYLHLADAYEREGNTDKTIEMLRKYSAKTNDVTAKLEIEKYIKQLKQ